MLEIRKHRFVLSFVLATALFALAEAYPAAQGTIGSILGTVSDSSGSVIPGATVTARNTGTGAIQLATTDAQGRYRLETIVPAEYPGRARHIHVKVQPPKGRVLTTQLYFPNEPSNQRDGIFRPELVMQMKERGQGAYDFVVG